MSSLQANETYVLEQPDGCKVIPRVQTQGQPKWYHSVQGQAGRQGIQRDSCSKGIDFTEVYAPVSKHSTMRALLALVVADDLVLRQLEA